MALVPVSTRNRVNPLSVSSIEQSTAPYVTYDYDHGELCTDPNCAVCRAQRHGRHHKHHKRHHHHRKHQTSFWNRLAPRIESPSTVSVHSIELDDRRSSYSPHVSERALVPVNRTERQVVSTTRVRRFADEDDFVREAWTPNRSSDDEIICCRAYNGCRCPCWCCIILIILFVIFIIILIILLATLL